MSPEDTLKAVQAVIEAEQLVLRQRELNETTYLKAIDRWVRDTQAKKAED